MRALDRKLFRDLAGLRGQVVTIAMVLAVGIASYVTLVSSFRSLIVARDTYYSATRFADAFAYLERAPRSLVGRLEALPGVAVVEARASEVVMLPMPDLPVPAIGRVVGIPSGREPALDAIVLRAGRFVEPGRANEAVVLESFVQANRLSLGDTIPVVQNGVLSDVRIVGTAISPEYVYSIAAGQFTQDDLLFAVLWMDERVVASAFRMEGAFNEVAFRFQPGAREREVLDAIDEVLRPYGGIGAFPRSRQPSSFIVDNELSQLESQSSLTLLFLVVGAFLLNVVLSRLVQLQRGEIAVLKALGYTNRDVGLHILELAGVIVAIGAALGLAGGALLGRGMVSLYARYFRFPALTLKLDAAVVGQALSVAVVAALVGAVGSVVRVIRLPPAEAMRPEAPPVVRPTLLERMGLTRIFEPVGRMIFRELVRRPVRTALNVAGVALAVAVSITGLISTDMIDNLEQIQFEASQREDFMVAFRQTAPDRAARDLAHIPGVLLVEPMRSVPARVRSGARWRDIAVTGHPEGATLRRVIAWPQRVVALPSEGVLLTDVLANILDVRPGDRVTLDVLEGGRPTRTVVVAGVVSDLFGLNAYMTLPALHALLGEAEGISAALLSVDPSEERRFEERLKAMPNVASVERRRSAIEKFEAQTAEQLWVTASILTGFGVVVALGVVYNAARVALSVRARDLATLRVLGFRRNEIAAVLTGELAVYVVAAIGPGLVFGGWFMRVAMGEGVVEMFRLPITASGLTYAAAILVTSLAAVISSLLVRRRLGALDLVAVLKAPE